VSDAKKLRVLMVGGFPRHRRVYGGQVSIGLRLLESDFVKDHVVRTVDSTQVANPPPALPVRAMLAAWRLIRFVFELLFHRPDAVILFLARGASVYEKGLMSLTAQWCGVPSLVFPRAGGMIEDFSVSPRHADFIRNSLGKADFFLCQGTTFQNFAVSELGLDQRRAPVIPNWSAEPAHLEIGRHRFAGARTSGATRALFLGWLEQPKGVFELLGAALALRQSGHDLHLTFAGDGTALKEARAFVEEHGLADRIAFAGWVDAEAKREHLSRSDIFVLPSWNEGLPNAMIEAMAAGLASVVTDVGMIPDFVTSERDALIVPARDVPALVNALSRLLANPDLRETIARNGHQLAASQFALESGVQKLSDAVANAVRDRSTSADRA
jgi:glycosyltransferase involved in cell wall biosynthesis